jgi:hypothetical protein
LLLAAAFFRHFSAALLLENTRTAAVVQIK